MIPWGPGGGLALLVVAIAAPCALAEDVLVEQGGVRLSLAEGRLRMTRGSALLADVRAIEFNFVAPTEVSIARREGNRVVLRAVYPAAAKYREDGEAAVADITLSTVPGGFHLAAEPEWARNVSVELRDLDDHYFGVVERLFPGNRRSPDLRGTAVDVEVVGEQSEYDENYSSAWSAFYMTSRGYASFFDTFARGRYVLGVGGRTELRHRTGKLDWYVFTGEDGDEILASYYRVIGTPKRVPMWALGPIGWRDQNDGGALEILEDVRRMTELRIPLTSWFVDRPYSDGAQQWSRMNWNAKFADPEKWIRTLRQQYGLELMTWIAPQTFEDPDFPGLFPGPPLYMDLSDPAAVAELEGRLKLHQYAAGVRGHKMDRADQLFPATLPWTDGTRESERRNRYVFLYAKVADAMLGRAWGRDNFNFARAAIHRTQPYLGAVWNGDSRGSWSGLEATVANAVRCGFMGFPVWGSDVGGYFGGRIDEELYARWLEVGALSGLFEIKLDDAGGRGDDRPPWAYGDRLQSAFRAACERRMQLLPYLYSLANTSSRHGVVMKPLAYAWPADAQTWDVADEYLLGPALLVAPVLAPGVRRSVYLPAGSWYPLDEPGAEAVPGARRVDAEASFDRIPVYVRANSVYVTGDVPIGNARAWTPDFAGRRSLTIHATPGAPGERSELEYVDSFDGDTPKAIALARDGAGGVSLKAPALGAAVTVRIRCDAEPRRATLGGRRAKIRYVPTEKAAVFLVPAGRPIDLTIAER